VIDRCRTAGVALALALTTAPGCTLGGSGGSGGYGTQGTGGGSSGPGGGSGVDETGGGACEYDPQGGCTVDADCCDNVPRLPASGSEAPGCPGTYPNRWAFQAGACVNLGCESDADCVLDGFSCETIAADGLEHCVYQCAQDSDCTENARMPGTKCLDRIQGGGSICVQDL
jgi:hypothetical protein